MTIWPARQHFEAGDKGSIEAGKLADFVILCDDPAAVDPETLDRLEVVKTIKEGEPIFAAEGVERRSRLTPDDPFHAVLVPVLEAVSR